MPYVLYTIEYDDDKCQNVTVDITGIYDDMEAMNKKIFELKKRYIPILWDDDESEEEIPDEDVEKVFDRLNNQDWGCIFRKYDILYKFFD